MCAAAALCVLVSVCLLLFDFRERQCVEGACCVAVLLCVALRCIGRSLWLSATVVAQQRLRCAGVCGAAVVLSHDTPSCSCILVALPPPSDAVLACRRP